MNNNTSSSIIYPLESPEANVRFVVYLGSLILGTFGGCTVLAAIITKQGNKTDNDIFLTNLAISDMLTIWVYVGVHFYLLSGHLYGKYFCLYFWPLMSVPLCASIFTITSMAVIRCRSILFMWTQMITQKTAKIWVLGLWIAAFIVLIPALAVSKSAGRFCHLDWSTISQRRAYVFFIFTVEYLFPLVIVLCCYVGIGMSLKKLEGQVQRENIQRENKDIIKAIAAIVIVFAIFLMPLQVGMMMWEFGNTKAKKLVLTFMNYADILCIFHSCLNPFIYGIVPREFRNRYSKWITVVINKIINNCCRLSRYKFREQRNMGGNNVYLGTTDDIIL
ncbi:type-1 angiotensin II receptor A-like [Actinia tenebrosa]|uniref:Type-1 angiotensin II receptor A-like n=1 Tax=Actinia tenebrosa TaxID=6105 RepID=A0A6P8IIY9_ACTTE|nr:type-1 angiotensin II receptor A-like [Actinia tenebrosa]XP_031566664.1 type-1 angiotensin II receptor A-like [Actinia tenebrosa]XP_031566673.1 type-1 angiotensin II receptor A-like [Actinia tenebrosa]